MFMATSETKAMYPVVVDSPLASSPSAKNGNRTADQNAPALIGVGSEADLGAARSFVGVEGVILKE